ncbi:MAG: hypothetical protein KGN35_12870 [Betaproteobacteria bacterium]|jgi:hypothetical protein|nr:hypothetical protein [Betaproteobacteria bacterium]
MFGGLHLLGEAPGADEIAPGGFPDWLEPKVPEGDFDMIAVAYLSPDAGYPYQRISNYNVPLAEQTQQLEGVGAVSKLPTRRRNYLASVMSPRMRF